MPERGRCQSPRARMAAREGRLSLCFSFHPRRPPRQGAGGHRAEFLWPSAGRSRVRARHCPNPVRRGKPGAICARLSIRDCRSAGNRAEAAQKLFPFAGRVGRRVRGAQDHSQGGKAGAICVRLPARHTSRDGRRIARSLDNQKRSPGAGRASGSICAPLSIPAARCGSERTKTA